MNHKVVAVPIVKDGDIKCILSPYFREAESFCVYFKNRPKGEQFSGRKPKKTHFFVARPSSVDPHRTPDKPIVYALD